MSAMPVDNMLTRADLDALPDNRLRHELIDGAFVMTASPGFWHQLMLGEIAILLSAACEGTGIEVLFAPLDVVLGSSVVKPDLIVAPRAAFTERDLPTAPLLIVEVSSPATDWLDQGRKRTLYEEHGVAHYWLADPYEPSVTVLDLIDGHYVETARAAGNEALTLTAPFALTLKAAELVA